MNQKDSNVYSYGGMRKFIRPRWGRITIMNYGNYKHLIPSGLRKKIKLRIDAL